MRVLIVGEFAGQLAEAAKIAMEAGAKIAQVDSIERATATLRAGRGADLLLVDATLDIGALIRANEQERIVVPVVACGLGTSPSVAAAAIHAGAKEFLPLPPEAELIAALLSAISNDERPLIARDPQMMTVLRMADQIAPSEASVLITGESGVGKEVIARRVHQRSRRADKQFISVNCAAIPENLLESELFGHEKGAFTGAIARRIGKFEEADGGTLLLDEITEMDARLQAKLLRALQERVIDRVGGGKPVPVNIRVIATSNRDMQEAVLLGEFREDLYYRLNVVNLRVPALRERRADIVPLAEHFIDHYSRTNGMAVRPLSPEAKEQVEQAHWRGNVRELENAMHRAVLLAQGEQIGVEAIRTPDGGLIGVSTNETARRAVDVAQAASRDLVGRTVAEVEQDLILSTLDHCLGNRTHAAVILGISIRTLRNKLKLYGDQGIAVPPPGGESRAA